MFRHKGIKRIRIQEFLDRYVENHLKIQVAKSWESEMGRVRRIAEFLGSLLSGADDVKSCSFDKTSVGFAVEAAPVHGCAQEVFVDVGFSEFTTQITLPRSKGGDRLHPPAA